MNPLTNMKNVLKLSERDLKGSSKSSWHDQYRDSAWIFVGGLPYDLTEGDLLAVFSQYGEIVNINLIRDKRSGKSKGFCFICFEDQRSTVLTVDNLNGIKILGRTIRVDHVSDYKPPKENDKTDEETRRLYMEGCAPKMQLSPESIKKEKDNQVCNSAPSDFNLPPLLSLEEGKHEHEANGKVKVKKEKKSKKSSKEKKAKKDKKSKKKKKERSNSSSDVQPPESREKRDSRKKSSKDRTMRDIDKGSHRIGQHSRSPKHEGEERVKKDRNRHRSRSTDRNKRYRTRSKSR